MKPAVERVEAERRASIDDCWNRIGVRGDHSCPQLPQHHHCRNCPVYGAAAGELLDGAPSAGSLEHWTAHFAQPKRAERADASSVLIFRTGAEWLALATSSVAEVADPRPIHSLPHSHGELILGVTNVRGELLVCVSLARLLSIETVKRSGPEERKRAYPRFVVLQGEDGRLVFPVDEAHGTHRAHSDDLRPLPATLAKAKATYTQAILAWRDHAVGLLDDRLVFYALSRSLA